MNPGRLNRLALPLLLLAPFSVHAQQTGVIVRTPGSPITGPSAVRVPPPKPSCTIPVDSTGAPSLPDLLFSREDLLCLRHADGRTEQLLNGLSWGFHSASDTDVAYWLPEKHELHVVSLATHADTLIDTLPGAILRDLVWSRTGRTLAYFPVNANPPGIRAINLDSGQRNIFSGSFVSVIPSLDPQSVVALGATGIERVHLSDGRRETIASLDSPAEAAYSPSGALLGVTVSSPTAASANSSSSASTTADDDSPDCTGGSFALVVQSTSSRQLIHIPFPQGYDTVLDFAFSPDDRSIAVTFGLVGCDYPGEAARIFKVSLPTLTLTPLTPADHLSVHAHWSPDGNVLLYTDYTGSDSPLIALDLRTARATKLTNPQQFGPDTFLAWH